MKMYKSKLVEITLDGNVRFENEDKLDSEYVPPILCPTIPLSPPSPNTPKKI